MVKFFENLLTNTSYNWKNAEHPKRKDTSNKNL